MTREGVGITLAGRHIKGSLIVRAQELCESRGGRPGLPVPNSLYVLRGREAAVKRMTHQSGESWREEANQRATRDSVSALAPS